MKNIREKLIRDKLDIVLLLLVVMLFGYFAFFKEVLEYGDSFQYLHQYPMREPVYSLLLQLLQTVFGEAFMPVLGYVQNLLAVICIYFGYRRLSDIYEFGPLFRIGTMVFLLAPHVLTPLASQTHLVLTDSVMTEGITVSVFYVWMTMLLGILTDYYGEKKSKAVTVNIVLATVLALTRGQMAVCIIMWLLVMIYKAIDTKKYKLIVLFAVVAVCAFPIKSQITKWYNLAETGFYVDTVSSKPMLLANIVYVAEEEDANAIEDEVLKKAFAQTVAKAKADGITFDNASGGIIEKALFHESVHEILNFEYVDPAMREVIAQKDGIDEEQFLQLMIREDELCGSVAKSVLPALAPRYIHNYIYIVMLGFVRSIAAEKAFLPLLALILYMAAVTLTVMLLLKNKKDKSAISMIAVLVGICGTVCGTSLVIECITRYMIYNLPFFYIAGMAMLNSVTKTYGIKKFLKKEAK